LLAIAGQEVVHTRLAGTQLWEVMPWRHNAAHAIASRVASALRKTRQTPTEYWAKRLANQLHR
jgi:hypothetical protein